MNAPERDPGLATSPAAARVIRALAARLTLALAYGTTLLVCALSRVVPRRHWTPTHKIAVTGTFYNPNWFRSHFVPLTGCGVEEVLLVCDRPWDGLDRVRFLCPAPWARRLFGRGLAKLGYLIAAGARHRPDVVIGYHVFPGSLMALIAARLLGRPACYQMTGGPTEVLGGGHGSENPVMGSLIRPSPVLERLALAVVRQFDLVVVRGSKARAFLEAHGVRAPITIITGSVAPSPVAEGNGRPCDLVFLARLTAIKQPLQFVEIVAEVKRVLPSVRAAVVGDGPYLSEMRARAAELEVGDAIEFLGRRHDVEVLLSQAKLVVLTSRSEGLSIAVAEAMAAGAVPVVADVGDLADLVTDGVSGSLIKPDQIPEYVDRVVRLLQDPALWSRQSGAAAAAAAAYCGVPAVTERWARALGEVVARSASVHARPGTERPLPPSAPAPPKGSR